MRGKTSGSKKLSTYVMTTLKCCKIFCLNVYIYYPTMIFMVSTQVTYLNSDEPRLSLEPNFLARNSVFWKFPNFHSRFFSQRKLYVRSNYDWKFSFLIPDGIPGKKSTTLRILREYSQILQLVPRILKCTLVTRSNLVNQSAAEIEPKKMARAPATLLRN